jgi:predicted dehydrogenase
MTPPSDVFVAGIGGFAGAHHGALLALEEEGLVRVRGACDPAPEAVLEPVYARFRFRERGVRVFRDFEPMLERAAPGAWVSIVAPIPVHAAMHEACVERRLPCYLEKPPTLDPEELEAMIATDRHAVVRTQVGFNHIGDPDRQELKRQLLEGRFGKLRRVSFRGSWKRNFRYFTRGAWTGKLLLGDRPLMDSCLGNGMSHHAHNLLFFAGREDLFTWAECVSLESEFYHANAIEGPDSVFVRGRLEGGVEIRLAMTHACAGDDFSLETLECEDADIRVWPSAIEVHWRDGRREDRPLSREFPLQGNLEAFTAYLRGEFPRPSTLLEDCRAVVRLNALAFAACREVHVIPKGWIDQLPGSAPEEEVRAIRGIDEALVRLVETGRFPSETGVPWGRPGGSATPEALSDLPARLERLRSVTSLAP